MGIGLRLLFKKTAQKATEKSSKTESTNVLSQDAVSYVTKIAGDLLQFLN